jgi:hypothetical protein
MKNAIIHYSQVCLLISGIIIVSCQTSQAQSWTTSADTVSSTGMIKAAGLNIYGNLVKMPGIVTDTHTDIMAIDIHGNVTPLTQAALNSIIYSPSWNPDACPSSGPTSTTAWAESNGAHPLLWTTSGCSYVGIDVDIPTVPLEVGGNAIILGTTTSTAVNVASNLNICPSYCTGNAAFYIKPSPSYTTAIEVDNYTSGNPVFTADKNGNVNVAGIVNAAGNVLIQTTNNEYALNVGGTIWSKEVQVCMSGCDFVFDKDYKLMPLKDLQQYLELNHHLPGIASAKEMETNDGVALGKMNSQLLQKVEELTLYLVQQQKELEKQQQEIKDLKDLASSTRNK